MTENEKQSNDDSTDTPKNQDVPDGSGTTGGGPDDANDAGEDTASGGPA